MKPDDLLYGSRSAIQKGIRRGDLDLVYTAFNNLWENKVQRNWLKWRLPIITEEEAWYMAGELSELNLDKKEDFLKFLYKLTLTTKVKDSNGLLGIAESYTNNLDHKEIQIMVKVLAALKEVGGDPSSVVSSLREILFSERNDISKYEMSAINTLLNRVYKGGMLWDRKACLSASILIATRGIDKNIILGSIKKKIIKVKRKPVKIDSFPWWVFDMHTSKGKWAMNIFLKKYQSVFPIEKENLSNLWFFMESAYIPKRDLILKNIKNNPSYEESIWWVPLIKKELSFSGENYKKNIERWKEIRPILKKLVEWCLSK